MVEKGKKNEEKMKKKKEKRKGKKKLGNVQKNFLWPFCVFSQKKLLKIQQAYLKWFSLLKEHKV